MLTIFTTTKLKFQVEAIISSIDRLAELVTVSINEKSVINDKILKVSNDSIYSPIDWFDKEVPYLFPVLPFQSDILLSMVFFKLGNHQKALAHCSENDTIYNHLLLVTHLQYGYEISEPLFQKIKSLHNLCVVYHYGNYSKKISFEALKQHYQKVIQQAENSDEKIFTLKHYASLLLDANAFETLEHELKTIDIKTLSVEAANTIHKLMALAMKGQLVLPYDKVNLETIEKLLNSSIEFYLNENDKANAGLLYIEVCEIVMFQQEFVKAKTYITKAIQCFKDENLQEFLGEANLQKAILLYQWSKNGSPQYYKPAINAFQDTLKIFKRHTQPLKFAEIQHYLGLIYSEMPASPEEKALWSAFSASAFKEALHLYSKGHNPYEYAMVAHNYATALMGFPEAKLHDNLEKANTLFEEALTIRTLTDFSIERSLTLANQIELLWLTHNETLEEESENYTKLLSKVEELSQIATDNTLLQKAKTHLEKLNQLKTVLY